MADSDSAATVLAFPGVAGSAASWFANEDMAQLPDSGTSGICYSFDGVCRGTPVIFARPAHDLVSFNQRLRQFQAPDQLCRKSGELPAQTPSVATNHATARIENP